MSVDVGIKPADEQHAHDGHDRRAVGVHDHGGPVFVDAGAETSPSDDADVQRRLRAANTQGCSCQ